MESEDARPFVPFAHVVPRDRLLKEAAASLARFKANKTISVFDGVPVAVKDMIEVEGLPTHFGTDFGPLHPPSTSDDPIVARFRAAGAIIIGTTTMTEFGVSPLGYNAKRKGPFNPYNTKYGRPIPRGCLA